MAEKITSVGPVTADSIVAEQLSPHRVEQTTAEQTTTANAEPPQLIEQTVVAQSTSPFVGQTTPSPATQTTPPLLLKMKAIVMESHSIP